MTSEPIASHDLIAALQKAANILKIARTNRTAITDFWRKDDDENIVTGTDIDVQVAITNHLLFHNFRGLIIGEENVMVATNNTCLEIFPENIAADEFVAIIDPIDGTKNWTEGSIYAITLALQHGNTIKFAAVHFPTCNTTYHSINSKIMAINGGTYVPVFKPFDRCYISICYGVGKKLSDHERTSFVYILCKLNQGRDVPVRYSCASYSFLQVFNGAMDAYISMKERWTNIAPLYHFAEILGYYISIDINTVPKNEDFTLALATPQFAKNHLNEGSELAVFMGITKFYDK